MGAVAPAASYLMPGVGGQTSRTLPAAGPPAVFGEWPSSTVQARELGSRPGPLAAGFLTAGPEWVAEATYEPGRGVVAERDSMCEEHSRPEGQIWPPRGPLEVHGEGPQHRAAESRLSPEAWAVGG